MSPKTLKDNELCKISVMYKDDIASHIKKEFKAQKALEKEMDIASSLSTSIQPEEQENSLIYPFLISLNNKVNKPIPEPEAIELMKTGLDILVDLQNCQIIHRDIKPGNLYLDESGNLLISDFETAISKNWPANDNTCGTPGFMAPEQYLSVNPDWLADQYSMGAVFYFILTGTLPFTGETPEDIRTKQLKQAPDPSSKNPKLRKPFVELTTKMMAPEKAYRFQSPEEIKEALELCSLSLEKNEILEDKSVKIVPKKKQEVKNQNHTLNIAILLAAIILVIILFKSL